MIPKLLNLGSLRGVGGKTAGGFGKALRGAAGGCGQRDANLLCFQDFATQKLHSFCVLRAGSENPGLQQYVALFHQNVHARL